MTMARDEAMELVGTVTQVLPGLLFRVALPNGQEVLAEVRGKMRRRFVRISVGHTVKLEMFPHDAGRAWITLKQG
jgi:translation initiation factor IF-1